MDKAKVRLYVDQPLAAGQAVALGPEAANYLFAVMRLGPGAAISLFNGRDGEWRAEVAEAGRRAGIALCQSQSAPQRNPPDLWLLFAPIKKARTDFIVEKAVELGVSQILPVTTRHMNADRLRAEKQQAHAVEAAEQCGATFVPQVADLQPLDRLLAKWPENRALFWADETLAGTPQPLPALAPGHPSAILIGPEGGFAEDEKTRLRALPFVRPMSLGPRILRAETAALAAIVQWQTSYGDWRS